MEIDPRYEYDAPQYFDLARNAMVNDGADQYFGLYYKMHINRSVTVYFMVYGMLCNMLYLLTETVETWLS